MGYGRRLMDNGEAELIGAFYQSVLTPESAWTDALERLQSCFRAEAAILGIYDPAAHNISLSFSCGAWTKDVMDSYAREFVKVDPAPAKFSSLPAGTATSSEKLLTAAERRGSIFYNEFLRPLDLADCLGARLLDIPGGFSALAVHSGRKRA